MNILISEFINSQTNAFDMYFTVRKILQNQCNVLTFFNETSVILLLSSSQKNVDFFSIIWLGQI